ncbi:GNAT family N-acetyltransferase [Paenibacillus segetis]|uniref:BioF2-like acetyltransferase domain-containing protein n=1 Tax=Paenibacillus segetis TaxID=1325360 RepID=A0ABQ1YMX8_9BACL|nr:GNAT family N-acetyltransferase [Paenibacillus segetis]GGH32132.1 hypothetical protein GCM10008013_36350 [Paenibacillus segetis]
MIEQTPLARWAEFNRQKWQCTVMNTQFQTPQSEAYGECLFFLNKRNNFFLPPQNPYHPIMFHTSSTTKPYRINKQWHIVANQMIDKLLKVRGSVILNLPPDISDIRPFTWRGFRADVKYTYCVDLPYSLEQASKAIRNKIRKAEAAGYRSIRSDNMEHVYQCLIETEKRQGFSHQLSVQDLILARDLMGEDAFRCYICYSKDNEPVSANISLILNQSQAIGWIAGSKSAHLSGGVVQHLQAYEFKDLESIGITRFDFTGANIASISESKSDWGGTLVPYYVIKKPGLKEVLRAGRYWYYFIKRLSQK